MQDRAEKALEAALRIEKGLQEAVEGRYYNDAWYFYMNRRDVEAVTYLVLDIYRKGNHEQGDQESGAAPQVHAERQQVEGPSG